MGRDLAVWEGRGRFSRLRAEKVTARPSEKLASRTFPRTGKLSDLDADK